MMNQNKMICYTAASEKGSRQKNEDNLGITGVFPWAQVDKSFSKTGQVPADELWIFSVCDGIGGAAMGELASRNALLGVQQYMLENGAEKEDLQKLLLEAAESAQRQVQALYRRLRCEGGCTLTMLAIRGDRYAFLNVGDSPAFHISGQNGALTELSQCHNLASMKVRKGIPAQKGDECYLVNYLGKPSSAADMAHVSSGTILEGDQFLLCSDGITNALSRELLQELLRQDSSAEEMVSMASEVQGADNCTAIRLKLTA